MTEPQELEFAASAEAILAVEDRGVEVVDVPEWRMKVRVLGMTGRQRDRFEASILERRGKVEVPNVDNIRAKVCAWCIVGADGERLFTEAQAEALGEKSAAAINRVYTVAARLSGISEEDVEEIGKALQDNPFAAASSTSPNGSDAPPGNSSTGSPPGRSQSGSPMTSSPPPRTGSPAQATGGTPPPERQPSA